MSLIFSLAGFILESEVVWTHETCNIPLQGMHKVICTLCELKWIGLRNILIYPFPILQVVMINHCIWWHMEAFIPGVLPQLSCWPQMCVKRRLLCIVVPCSTGFHSKHMLWKCTTFYFVEQTIGHCSPITIIRSKWLSAELSATHWYKFGTMDCKSI